MEMDAIPAETLRWDTEAIDDRLAVSVIAAGTPVPLSIGLGMAYEVLAEGSAVNAVGINLSYGLASLLTIVAIAVGLTPSEHDAIFQFDRPSRAELTWTAVGFPVGTAAFLGGTAVMNALGFTLGGYQYSLAEPLTVAAVVFGAVLLTPFAEEVLFRGFLLGSLLGRGVSPLIAGLMSIVAFGLLHVALLGVAGVVVTALWSVVPTVLRLRFNNLTGAWLLHLVNNIWAYLVVVALGID
jgi:membrane protease YdiL (CAAX protease family)